MLHQTEPGRQNALAEPCPEGRNRISLLPAFRARPVLRRLVLALSFLAVHETAVAENPSAVLKPGKPVLMTGTYDVSALGYTAEEFFLEGRARAFSPLGTLREDGNWAVAPAASAGYKTRAVVLRPRDPERFNGTVIVEWLNVTGGFDMPVVWVNVHREIVRSGYAYVAVSAQKTGVEGDGRPDSPAPFLKKASPERYNELVHPGDAYAYDIFSDAGRLIRRSGPDGLLGGLRPRALIAAGESQSAFFLVTYVNAVDPLAKVYDGFLIHARAAAGAPLEGIAAPDPSWLQKPVRLRSGLRVPVLQLISETDLVQLLMARGYWAARQPDTARLRTWEVAGSAHLDNYLFRAGHADVPGIPIPQLAALWAPLNTGTGKPINNGPQQHYVAQAALHFLNRWVLGGRPPARASWIELIPGDPPSIRRDSNGIAIGGVRTPWVDVPIARLSGSDPETRHQIGGSTEPFSREKLAALYPGGKSDYRKRFQASLDDAIRKGFLLEADRAEILELAEAAFDQAFGKE